MDTVYKDAIDVLENITQEQYRKIIVMFAKEAPDIFVKVAKEARISFEPVWLVEARKTALATGNKIAVIKRIREVTGWGLKEAKDASESFGFNYEY